MPSLRQRKRYMKFEITSERKLEYYEIRDAVTNSIVSWIGTKGTARSGFRLIKNLWEPQKSEGVLQCDPKFVDDIKVALALIRQIGDSKVIFIVTKVSGTIKSLRQN